MTAARVRAVTFAVDQLGAPVLMGYRGDVRFDRETRVLVPTGLPFWVWDCSGLFGGAMEAAGLKNMRSTHNAQLYFDQSRELGPGESPQPGDPVLYGFDEKRIEHIAMWLAGGQVVSADGATWGITTLEQAKASRCKVSLHDSIHFRTDLPFVRVRRLEQLDAVDNVSR